MDRTDLDYQERDHTQDEEGCRLSRSGQNQILDNTGAEIDPASINWSSTQAAAYTLRQDAGNSNALGNIRINMPNKDSVYMHDTPSKRFFNSDYRFQSMVACASKTSSILPNGC